MPKLRVDILFGGKSVEHEVSVQSARGEGEPAEKVFSRLRKKHGLKGEV